MIKQLVTTLLFLAMMPSICFAGDEQSIKGPIAILDVWIARDGGTISISFKDYEEKLFEVCRDNRLDVPSHYSYIGAMYPTEKNAIKLEHGSPTENLLIYLLEQWISTKENKIGQIDQKSRKNIIWQINMIKRFISLISETKS
jgi:hypothetical protein